MEVPTNAPGTMDPSAATQLITPAQDLPPITDPTPDAPISPMSLITKDPAFAAPAPDAAAAPGSPTPGSIHQESWRDAFPDQIKDNPLLTKYNSVDDFFNGVQNLATMAGKKGLTLPENADEQTMADYYAARGRPAQPSDYEWQPPQMDDGSGAGIVDIAPDALMTIKEEMHRAGVPGDAFGKVMDIWANDQYAAEQASQQAAQVKATQDIADLQTRWGGDFDVNVKRVNALLNRAGVADELIDLGLQNSSKLMQMVHGLLEQTGTTTSFDPVDPITNKTVDTRIAEIQGSEAWKNPGHPDHETIKVQMLELFKRKVG